MGKQQVYWIQGDEQKDYFTGPDAGERLLQFLRDNDPVECGADMLEAETVAKLDALKDDELLPSEEIV